MELDKNPAYGSFKDLKLDEITAKIDWLIKENYLDIQYDYRLPLLVYAPKGWAIERETYAEELFQGFMKMLDNGCEGFIMTHMQEVNREVTLLLLEKIKLSGDVRFIPLLEDWKKVAFKKVQKVIKDVLVVLNHRA